MKTKFATQGSVALEPEESSLVELRVVHGGRNADMRADRPDGARATLELRDFLDSRWGFRFSSKLSERVFGYACGIAGAVALFAFSFGFPI